VVEDQAVVLVVVDAKDNFNRSIIARERSHLLNSNKCDRFLFSNQTVLVMNKIIVLALTAILGGCAISSEAQIEPSPLLLTQNSSAKIVRVETTGTENNYTFAVTVSSPDTGCARFADWWEVITPAGELLERRVLLHSHVDEQPFTRTGGTVAISPEQKVIFRVHMSDSGYSPIAQQGTVETGFSETILPADFASSLADVEPLPGKCAF